MTLEELYGLLDETITSTDDDVKAVKLTDLKMAMRDYKEERDDTELKKDAEIEALKGDIVKKDETISELREANSILAVKYSRRAEPEPDEPAEPKKVYEIDDLIQKFD